MSFTELAFFAGLGAAIAALVLWIGRPDDGEE